LGLLNQLFAGTAADAEAFTSASRPGRALPIGGMTSLEFESLWSILDGRDWDPKVHSLDELRSSESDWLFRLPAPFVGALVGAPAASLDGVAAAWARTEELACEPDEIRPVLIGLIELARDARTAGLSLFLYVSL